MLNNNNNNNKIEVFSFPDTHRPQARSRRRRSSWDAGNGGDGGDASWATKGGEEEEEVNGADKRWDNDKMRKKVKITTNR